MGGHRGLRTWILFLSAAPALTVFSSAPLTVIYLHPADKNGLLTPLHWQIQTGWPFLSTTAHLNLHVHSKIFFIPFTECNWHVDVRRGGAPEDELRTEKAHYNMQCVFEYKCLFRNHRCLGVISIFPFLTLTWHANQVFAFLLKQEIASELFTREGVGDTVTWN